MIRRIAVLAIFGVAMLSLNSGCGPSVSKVEVKITLDGAPLPEAAVSFTSENSATIYSGVTDANGVAKITNGKENVPPGTYKVTVVKLEKLDASGDPMAAMKKHAGSAASTAPQKGPPGLGSADHSGRASKSLIPTKYGEAATSGFTYNAPADASSVKEFSLSTK